MRKRQKDKCGIFPVWYDNDTEKDYRDYPKDCVPSAEYLHIHEWDELIDVLERLKK